MRANEGRVGDGRTSDVGGVGFDTIQDFEILTNDNEDKKLLNAYDVTEICVDDGIENTSLSGTTELYLPRTPKGWYPSVASTD